MSGYLVTGATGMVGGALTLELLQSTDAPLHLLVRGGDTAAEDRCLFALQEAAESYGLERDFVSRQRGRLHIVVGDLTSSAVIERLPDRDIGEVWHCAASLKFDDRSRDEIFAVNVDGTARLLDLSEKVGATRFNYISTAYVAGSTVGRIDESAVPPDACANNQYELSKIAAEHLVSSCDSISTCIWRPSIVVGHSTTLATTSFTGLYGLVRDAFRFKRRTQKVFGPGFVPRQTRVLADPTAEANLIPVDLLVRQAVSLSTLPGFEADIVHLTNGAAPSLRDVLSVTAEATGVREPEYVTSADSLTALDRRLRKAMQFYAPQGGGTKFFAQDVAEQYGSPLRFPMDVDYLRALIGWYIGHAGLADRSRAA
ncbi:SDR family oxidoreductase [Nocardia suismassiliense]|uniref:SDR family oxidoreductase n=1 Tax=Nocardia suismassiliense TaxID=2077092 RepID=A0ABW6R2X5_9NOCA